MALFQFRWLRRFFRRHTKPIPVDRAALWKQRLSIAYMLIAWNGVGVIVYLYASDKFDPAKYYGLKTEAELAEKKPAIYFADLLGVKKAKVISVKGFQKTEEYQYEKETENK